MRHSLRIAILSLVVGSLTVPCHARGRPVPDEATAIKLRRRFLSRSTAGNRLNPSSPLPQGSMETCGLCVGICHQDGLVALPQ